jgi:chorismate mutase
VSDVSDDQAARSLRELRAELAVVDAEIIALVARRMRLVREVGAAKHVSGQPVIDPAREAEVVARASGLAREAGVPEDEVRALYRHLMAMARRVQVE